MFIPKLILLALTLVALVLALPAEPTWDTPEDIAALAILNDLTHKPIDLNFMPELGQYNVTAQATYICDTTTGSPRAYDVRQVAIGLRDRFGEAMCRQENHFESKCTQLLAWGNAAVSMCGVPMRWMPCSTAAWAVFWIVDHCEWKGLAGGRLFFDDDPPSRIAVHKRF
ncbi:hypothetical protein L873DRAFT_1820015 [Choiromyces venosus 120613-1]|uniref:Ecp2 effector protein domain-containing protein n=1 Tax=Choiromyces venosus 120613-1 TaxID=1336337 RepID=A0A3N4J1I2_9PEZI|nr:hypothetical protein L873DRAFT_1820015 [Choiromyces venosus 120613-1]